jgi:hypothetical protein
MNQVSRPLVIALVAVGGLFAVWMVALRPHSSNGGSTSPQASPPTPAAHAVVQPQPQARGSVRTHNQPNTHTRPQVPSASASASPAHPAARSRLVTTTPTSRLAAVQQALARGKVLALLFYNPAAADDVAVKQELASIPASGGRVFKLEVPLAEVSSYAQLTNQIPVNLSPTLVIVDRSRQAREIVGFADSFEISARLSTALRAPAAVH